MHYEMQPTHDFGVNTLMIPATAAAILQRRHTGGNVAYSVAILCVVYCTFCIEAHAQTSTISPLTDSTLSLNSIRIGLNKLANTFVFRGDADVQQPLFGGTLKVNQNYRGTTVRSTSSAFRDDEQLQIEHTVPLASAVDFYSRINWLVSVDSRAIGLSSLERLQLIAGTKYQADTTLLLNGFGGVERNKQLGNTDVGPVLGGVVDWNDVIDQFNVAGGVKGEASIFPQRLNGEIEATGKTFLYDKYNNDNFLSLTASYRALNRDFYSLFNLQTGTSTSIETRLEQRYLLEALFGLTIAPNVSGSLGITTSDLLVKRAFKQPIEGYTNTSANRNLDQLNIALNTQLQYAKANFRQQFALNAVIGYEDNTVTNHFTNITQVQLDTIVNIERLRNISFKRTRVSSVTNWNLHERDTLSCNAALSILSYDTPSEKNIDDRDELQQSIGITYAHRYHSGLAAGMLFQYQSNHLVFLKSLRSALNNENKIYRLAPYMVYNGYGIHSQPQMEVLAQYTVYDFDGRAGVPQSFSFRQLGIRDSIIISISPTLYSETRLYFRYFTRGEFYNEEFSELLLSKNYEQFVRSLFFTSAYENVQLGAGVRWYALSQENTSQTNATTLLQSIAPDCSIIWNVSNGTQLVINGWYEFQFTNRVRSRLLPNMNLHVQKTL